jgi:hypothetical protein
VIGTVLSLRGSFPCRAGGHHELPVVIVALLTGRFLEQLARQKPGADPLAIALVLIAGTTTPFRFCCLLLRLGKVGDSSASSPIRYWGGSWPEAGCSW